MPTNSGSTSNIQQLNITGNARTVWEQGLCICRASVSQSVCPSMGQSSKLSCWVAWLAGNIDRLLHGAQQHGTWQATRAVPRCQRTYRGVVVRERSGTPFRQIFWSRNGAPANIAGHRWNANTEAFRQITSYSLGWPSISLFSGRNCPQTREWQQKSQKKLAGVTPLSGRGQPPPLPTPAWRGGKSSNVAGT